MDLGFLYPEHDDGAKASRGTVATYSVQDFAEAFHEEKLAFSSLSFSQAYPNYARLS